MFGLFGYKRKLDKLRDDVQDSFNHVKKDFNKVGEWIKHLDDKYFFYKGEVSEIKNQLLNINEEIMELKDFVSFFGPQLSRGLFKQTQTDGGKQTGGVDVQTSVQTSVQTDILYNLTVMERAIVWALLNSEMKLSYEDLGALLGKDKSTIRGQINTIKQKNGGIIMEKRELNGKKRLYIPDDIRSLVLKNIKIKINDKRLYKNRKK